jgi:hypothetical protein
VSKRTEIAIEIAALVIALSAIGVTVWQGVEQRSHNRLSVKPALIFDTDEIADGTKVAITLKNSGTGPAIIKQFVIHVDDTPMPEKDNGMWIAAEKLLNLSDPKFKYHDYHYVSGDVISINENQVIIGMERETYYKLSDSDKVFWKQAIPRIKILVKYTSIYDEEFNAIYPGATKSH